MNTNINNDEFFINDILQMINFNDWLTEKLNIRWVFIWFRDKTETIDDTRFSNNDKENIDKYLCKLNIDKLWQTRHLLILFAITNNENSFISIDLVSMSFIHFSHCISFNYFALAWFIDVIFDVAARQLQNSHKKVNSNRYSFLYL